MLIGVLSDTHSRALPAQLLNDFKKVDLILHTGDLCGEEDLSVLTSLKETRAVCGNMDDEALCQALPKKDILKCEDVFIGLAHGEGQPNGVLDKVRDIFKNDKVDAVVFGHSHQPCLETIDGVLYLNPGSPNDKVFAPYCSYGLLEITGKQIKGKIIKVEE